VAGVVALQHVDGMRPRGALQPGVAGERPEVVLAALLAYPLGETVLERRQDLDPGRRRRQHLLGPRGILEHGAL
jgi:hypothetical protein